jgi:hypothetical protein
MEVTMVGKSYRAVSMALVMVLTLAGCYTAGTRGPAGPKPEPPPPPEPPRVVVELEEPIGFSPEGVPVEFVGTWAGMASPQIGVSFDVTMTFAGDAVFPVVGTAQFDHLWVVCDYTLTATESPDDPLSVELVPVTEHSKCEPGAVATLEPREEGLIVVRYYNKYHSWRALSPLWKQR